MWHKVALIDNYKKLGIINEYSRTRLRRTRLGNNKKYVLTEVRRVAVGMGICGFSHMGWEWE